MVQRNSGRILFTASIAGEMVAPREAVYAAEDGRRSYSGRTGELGTQLQFKNELR
jgi:hypothetical protein